MAEVIEAIQWQDDTLVIIDQRALPVELKRLSLRRHIEVVEAIQSLAVRGAPAIGIAGAFAVALAVKEARALTAAEGAEFVTRALDEIEHARPTAVNLSKAANIQRLVVEDSNTINDSLFARLVESASAIHEEDKQMCQRIGDYGAELIAKHWDSATALTICNAGALATGGIGTALGVLYVAHEQGRLAGVYSCETRPLLQGSRLTCWELQQAGIDVTLIVDSVAGTLLKQNKIDFVIAGADRIANNGDTANKIGTYTLATLAKAHDVPFYIAAPETTFDRELESLSEDVIEQRDPIEVTNGFGRQTAPKGINVYSPAFDITPNEMITAFITDTGVTPGGRA